MTQRDPAKDRGYWHGHPKQYEIQRCCVCGGPKPTTTKKGKRLSEWGHSQLKTCGKTECVGDAMLAGRGKVRILGRERAFSQGRQVVKSPPIDAAWEQFTGGRVMG
jgi:hypothetical protein